MSSFFRYIRESRAYPGTSAEKRAALAFLLRLHWKEKRYDIPPRPITESIFGFRIHSYQYAILKYLFEEIFLHQDYAFEPTRPDPLIIDAGANIGMSVLYFKYRYPKARIIAFEPNPAVFSLLERNVGDNQLREVELHAAVLGDTEGPVAFYTSDVPGTFLGSVLSTRGGQHEHQLPGVRLSAFLREQEQVDLVKMDVEGAESLIVRELDEAGLLGKPEQYLIEYHHQQAGASGNGLAGFLRRFEQQGYHYTIRSHDTRYDPFQDILLHCYRPKKA